MSYFKCLYHYGRVQLTEEAKATEDTLSSRSGTGVFISLCFGSALNDGAAALLPSHVFVSTISFQKGEQWVRTITGSADSAVFNIMVDVKKAFWSHGQPGPFPKDKKYKNVEI